MDQKELQMLVEAAQLLLHNSFKLWFCSYDYYFIQFIFWLDTFI